MSLLICSFLLFFCRVHPSFFLKLKSVTTDPWRSRSSIRIFCPQRYSWVISVFKWISNGFFYRLSSLHHYVLGPIILKSLISTHGGQEVKKNLSELSILIVTCHECSSYCLCDCCRPLEQLCRSSWQSPIFLSRTWSPCAHHMCQNFVAFFSLIHWFDFKPLHRPHLYKAGNKSASLLFATASQPTCLLCSCTFSSRWTCIQTCNKCFPCLWHFSSCIQRGYGYSFANLNLTRDPLTSFASSILIWLLKWGLEAWPKFLLHITPSSLCI